MQVSHGRPQLLNRVIAPMHGQFSLRDYVFQFLAVVFGHLSEELKGVCAFSLSHAMEVDAYVQIAILRLHLFPSTAPRLLLLRRLCLFLLTAWVEVAAAIALRLLFLFRLQQKATLRLGMDLTHFLVVMDQVGLISLSCILPLLVFLSFLF